MLQFNSMQISRLFSHTVSQNALANALRTVFQVIIGIVGNYLIVRSVSVETLGLWALTLTFASFLNLSDMGMSTALIKHVASDAKRRHEYFWTTTLFYCLVGTIISGILVVFLGLFGSLFFKDIQPAPQFFALTLAGVFVGLLTSAILNTLNGLQLMKRTSSVEVSKSFTYYVFTLSLIPSLGVMAFPVGFLGSNIFGGSLALTLLLSKASIPFTFPNKVTFKQLFFFGIKSYGLGITDLAKTSFLKLITSWLFIIEFVAFIDLAQKIIGYIKQFLASIVFPLLPAASLYQARQEDDKIRRLYVWSLIIVLGLGLVTSVTYILLAPFIITLWLGTQYTPVILLSQIGSAAIFFNLLSGPAYAVLQGMGKQKPLLVTSLVSLVVFVVLVSVFAWMRGLPGTMQGYLITEALTSTGLIIWLSRKTLLFKLSPHISRSPAKI